MSIIGVGYWIMYAFFDLGYYPSRTHALMMIGPYMLSFIVGFLLTAFPKFTHTRAASSGEVFPLLLLLIGASLAIIVQNFTFFAIFYFLTFAGLMAFALRRVFHSQSEMPYPFLFVIFGVLTTLIGAVIFLIVEQGLLTGPWIFLGKKLLYYGLIQSVILGIGMRVIPIQFGHEMMADHESWTYKTVVFLMLCLMLFASYFVETFINSSAGTGIRSFVFGFVFIVIWQIYRLPDNFNRYTFFLWLSSWFIFLSSVLETFFPAYQLHLAHVGFISGVGMMTYFIASFVVTMHGRMDYSFLAESKLIYVLGFGFILAAATRVTAVLMPETYVHHLSYASIIWIATVLVWSVKFLPVIFNLLKTIDHDSPEHPDHC